jgi:hypothetical protein
MKFLIVQFSKNKGGNIFYYAERIEETRRERGGEIKARIATNKIYTT